MAPRKSKVCGHSEFINSCPGCKCKKAKKAAEEVTKLFRADVEKEFVCMKSFPVLNDSARKKAEKERKILNKKLRDLQREYKGPPLFSSPARQAERKRLRKLQQDFNKADARWSKIRQEANIKYLGWSNSKLEKMFKDAKVDLVHLDFAQIELKDSIAETEGTIVKFREYRRTGNRSTANG